MFFIFKLLSICFHCMGPSSSWTTVSSFTTTPAANNLSVKRLAFRFLGRQVR
jgi:hypothetical protein